MCSACDLTSELSFSQEDERWEIRHTVPAGPSDVLRLPNTIQLDFATVLPQ